MLKRQRERIFWAMAPKHRYWCFSIMNNQSLCGAFNNKTEFTGLVIVGSTSAILTAS